MEEDPKLEPRQAQRANDVPERLAVQLASSARIFAARWPGLASSPTLARLPFERAVLAWGRTYAEAVDAVGPVACAIDPEVELVAARVKPACLKETVPTADAADLVAAYRAMGLCAEIVDHHALDGRGLHSAGRDFAIVAVAAAGDELERVLVAQRAHAQARGTAPVESMGHSMGYPECCVRAFAAQGTRRDNADNERLTFRRAPAQALAVALNRLGRIRLIGHHLCSPSCAPSTRLAEAVIAKIAAADASAASRVLARLRVPVLLLDIDRRAEVCGRWEGDEFAVESLASLDGAPWSVERAGVARILVERARVVFVCSDGQHVQIDADRPLFATPSAPLAPVALAAIGGALPVDVPGPARSVPRAPPPLASAIRPGTRVLGYRILAVTTIDGGHTITVGNGAHRFDVRARARRDAEIPGTALPCGRWFVEVDGLDVLPEPARAALGLLLRALSA